jgi:hypothetical protein
MKPRANDTPRYFSDHILCAVALAKKVEVVGEVESAPLVLCSRPVVCACSRSDGFYQGWPGEVCESEVRVGMHFVCHISELFTSHFCETVVHSSAGNGLGCTLERSSWTSPNKDQGYTCIRSTSVDQNASISGSDEPSKRTKNDKTA